MPAKPTLITARVRNSDMGGTQGYDKQTMMQSCATNSPPTKTSSRPEACRSRGIGGLPWLLMALCLTVLVGCDQGNKPIEVSLSELTERPAVYGGRVVRTRGTVRGFDDPRHYWLEDENLNRVGLLPEERVAPHLGRQITVLGQFSYTRDRGRRIRVGTIEDYDGRR